MLMLIDPEARLAFLTKVMEGAAPAYKRTQEGHPGAQRLLKMFQPQVYAQHVIHEREKLC